MKFTHNNNEYELLVLCLAGSKLYGNSRPESDTDYRGIFIASNDSKLGLLNAVEQIEGYSVLESLRDSGMDLEETDDIVLYEINRFCKLALDNNPNIMDILCHDMNSPAALYQNSAGRQLLKSKDLFLSKKLKHTFSGYAMSQLKRIKSHNKWIVEFPYTDEVLNTLNSLNEKGKVDFDWLCDNFGGQVAEKITGETPQENTKLKKEDLIPWLGYGSFVDLFPTFDISKYRLPRLIDYCHAKDLKAKQYPMWELNANFYLGDSDRATPGFFLEHWASFRSLSPSMLVCYTDGNGIFTKEGQLRPNDPEKIGEFVCLLTIDHMNFKKDRDHVGKMWNWKCNRNEKRSALEEKFGYDTKHASHLVRLMEGARDILSTGKYTPELSGDRLKLVNDVRDGQWTYDRLLEYAEKLDAELEEDYKNSDLQNKPKVKEVNEMILKIMHSHYEQNQAQANTLQFKE